MAVSLCCARLYIMRIRSKYKSGMTFGLLTLEEEAFEYGPFGRYSNGYWWARCQCGARVKTSTQHLHKGSPSGTGCPICKPRKQRRKANHEGKVVGRLTIGDWVRGKGWECACECGTVEYVRKSSNLGFAGLRDCPHVDPTDDDFRPPA